MGFQYVDPIDDNHPNEISRKENKKEKNNYKTEETKGVNGSVGRSREEYRIESRKS